MNTFWVIFKKEFRSFFTSPIAYIYISLFTVFMGWLFFRTFFLIGQATMRDFFSILPWVFLFYVPAITMRIWSEEKKLDTMEILLTLPVRNYQIVLGKYFACLVLLICTVALTLPLYLCVALLANPAPDHGAILCSYLGSILLGGAYAAIGVYMSSLTENQIIAFIMGVAVSFFLFIIGENIVLYSLPPLFVAILHNLGLGAHFESISRGVIDSRDLLYYFSLIYFFLYLNIQSLELGKWK